MLGLFTFGPGWALAGYVARKIGALERVIVLCGVGTAAAPALADLLGRINGFDAFPYVSCSLAGAAAATWRTPHLDERSESSKPLRGLVCLLPLALALGTGLIVFAHRLETRPDGVTVFGDYDSVDLSYYAAITSELTHRVPPNAPFYSGHPLNYSYYPQLLLALVHRFGAVATLEMYFRYGWPAFLALAALVCFVFVRAISSEVVAVLASVLILLGGDFSYLAAWGLRPTTYLWDYVLWPTNFLAPTMEVLHFSTWTPSLPVLFAGLYALARDEQEPHAGWVLTASCCFAALVEFKPFAFAVLMGGLTLAAAASRQDTRSRRRFSLVFVGSLVLALPFVYQIVSLYSESRSRLAIDYFLLPRTMLEKLDLGTTFSHWTAAIGLTGWPQQLLVLLMATVIFFIGGLGARWLGVRGVWHALRGRQPDRPIWRVLGWSILVGLTIHFIIVTRPYHDTLQFYQTALFLLWIFAARALVVGTEHSVVQRGGAVAIVMLLALPSSLHYLSRKWSDDRRPPLAHLSAAELRIAEHLRRLDPEQTVVLHDGPLEPSLLAIVAERRTVLGWGRYVTGSEARQQDVNRFFSSANGDPAEAVEILRRYAVTHVIDRVPRDRIHPDVLLQLRAILHGRAAVLYEVPPGL